jgi:hypothetical protein
MFKTNFLLKALSIIAIHILFLSSAISQSVADSVSSGSQNSSGQDYLQPLFAPPQDRGLLDHDPIDEASGLVASQMNSNVLWTHNDSGGKSKVYAIDLDGKYLGRIKLDGIEVRDWEDISCGPGPKDGVPYLYIGETGDNKAAHPSVSVYRFPEPDISRYGKPLKIDAVGVEKLTFVFPEGPRDCEALMVDPVTKDLVFISKHEPEVSVFISYYPQATDAINMLEEIAIIPMTLVTAGDITQSGSEILIKNYQSISYWYREDGENLRDVFSRPPVDVPYEAEPQGESICWDKSGIDFYTVSEERFRIPTRLLYYSRIINETSE